MDIKYEELTHSNLKKAQMIDRDDISEDYVDDLDTLMELTDYGVEHECIGHTFMASMDERPVGVILLGEAIPWETDPPQVKEHPFYRLMGFVIDKKYRSQGIGGRILEDTIKRVCAEFGERPIVLGVHKENYKAAAFYKKHGFVKTEYMEDEDVYYIRE